MTAEKIENLSTAEISKKLRERCSELVNMRLRKATAQVERPHELKLLRRDIARLKTFERKKI